VLYWESSSSVAGRRNVVEIWVVFGRWMGKILMWVKSVATITHPRGQRGA